MEVLVDPRVGSGDLVAPLVTLGVPARAEHLPFGDVQIVGRGPEERPVLIGVEIKAIGDLLRCIVDQRFAGHQLLGLVPSYEIPFLLIEGVMTASASRELMVLKPCPEKTHRAMGHLCWDKAPFGERPWRYEDVQSWLTSMRRTGLLIDKTADRHGTAAWLAALWTNWSKPWEEHRSHLGMYLKPLEAEKGENALELREVTRKMRVAAALNAGIGGVRARAADEYFRSVKEMMSAGVEEWQRVEGIGKKLAASLVAAVNEVKGGRRE